MDQSILLWILSVVLTACCSKVALSVPIALEVSIDSNCQGICSNVELPVLVQKWLLHILLDDIGSLAAIDTACIDNAFDVVQVSAYLDAASSIGVLSWLHNPHGGSKFGILL